MGKIDGKKIAQQIIEKLKSEPTQKKILAAILVGDKSASVGFLKQKEKVAEELGVDFRLYQFDKNIKNDDLRFEVGEIAGHKPVGGVIIQLPLPEHINRHYILNAIPREKDVDVLSERALGAFYAGRNLILPPAVGTVEEILNSESYVLNGKKAAVVGAGFLVGKPVAIWLIGKTKLLAIFEKGSDLSELKNFDLIVSGAGQTGIIKPEMTKDGAALIDFGYSIDENGKICGDFDDNRLLKNEEKLSFYTPTPGGTGPILTAKIFENFFKLNRKIK